MRIDKKLITVLQYNHLTADEFIYLYNEYFKCGWDWILSPGAILKLKKMGFLDEDSKVSVIGEAMLLDLTPEASLETPTVDNLEIQFEEFWKLFPRDDAFRQFSKTRTLRSNKVETLRQYKTARQDYSHEQLIVALKNDIAYKSGSTIKNMFTYMKGSVNWLKDKAFLDFLEVEPEVEEPNFHGKNINM